MDDPAGMAVGDPLEDLPQNFRGQPVVQLSPAAVARPVVVRAFAAAPRVAGGRQTQIDGELDPPVVHLHVILQRVLPRRLPQQVRRAVEGAFSEVGRHVLPSAAGGGVVASGRRAELGIHVGFDLEVGVGVSPRAFVGSGGPGAFGHQRPPCGLVPGEVDAAEGPVPDGLEDRYLDGGRDDPPTYGRGRKGRRGKRRGQRRRCRRRREPRIASGAIATTPERRRRRRRGRGGGSRREEGVGAWAQEEEDCGRSYCY
mmetsp:Transcript_54067/g.114829  ORF Transcript_54067/g.114829 Transcript_54067/m.114829 type:complete len:256 (+) Transcript_54067:995-1762(+)